MTMLKESAELLKRYMIGRIPFIMLDTIERARVLDEVKHIGSDLSLAVYVHTLSKGTYDIQSNKAVDDDKSIYGAIDFFGEQIKRRQNLTLVLTEIPDLSGDNSDSRQLLDLVNLANENGGAIIAFTNNNDMRSIIFSKDNTVTIKLNKFMASKAS